jgi:hypothetical protein
MAWSRPPLAARLLEWINKCEARKQLLRWRSIGQKHGKDPETGEGDYFD